MCVERLWKVGLVERWIANWLSHNTKVESMNTSKSRSKATIHVISLAIAAKDLYSASIADLEIVACFLDFQDTKEEPRKIQKPVVDLRVSRQLSQSTSAYPFILKSDVAEKKRP